MTLSPAVMRAKRPLVSMQSAAVQTDRNVDTRLKELKRDLGFPPDGAMYQRQNRVPIDRRNVRPGVETSPDALCGNCHANDAMLTSRGLALSLCLLRPLHVV